MSRRLIIFLTVALCCVQLAHAQARFPADTLSKADTLSQTDTLTDAEILQFLTPPPVDTVAKAKNKGRDVSRLIRAKRQRAVDATPFESKPFMKNTFVSAGMTMQLLSVDNHSIGRLGTLSFGKWLHEDHALRLNIGAGLWHDNYDSSPITGIEADLSYMFNVSSYVFGYNTGRFCDISIVAGAGYAGSSVARTAGIDEVAKEYGNAFSCHLGANLTFRIFKSIDLFFEPQVVVFSDQISTYTGSWRGWTPAFRGTVGLTYNILQSYSSDSPLLIPRKEGYFISLTGGPSWQNSSLAYNALGLADALGVHLALGVGKYYTDYFAMRYSAACVRNPWVIYGEETYPCTYLALRVEGMLDVLGLVRHVMYKGENTRHPYLSASIVFGPEIGYMYKKDLKDAITGIYMGVSAGAQVKFRVAPKLSLFIEPRFNIVPYVAPTNGSELNKSRNYYDGVVNFNAGIELNL